MKKTILSSLLVLCAANAANAEVNPNRRFNSATQAEALQTFIFTFKDDFGGDPEQRAQQLAARHNGTVKFVYKSAMRGFAARMSDMAAGILLRNNPEIASVERDAVATTQQTAGEVTPAGITRVGGSANVVIDATTTPKQINGRIWVIDTGIDLDHPDLNVDVANGVTYVSGANKNDLNGHGTHVAGIAAAVDNEQGVVGVAAGAWVVPVQVLDQNGSGPWSQVIAGIDYVKGKRDALCKSRTGYSTTGQCAPQFWVANISIGGPKSSAVTKSVRSAADAGVRFAIAAGNNSADSNNYSPASAGVPKHRNIFVVSASSATDDLASFSNFANPPVIFAAPGVNITSTYKDGGYATLNGTSMASPHVAGVLVRNPLLQTTDTTLNYNGCLKTDRDAIKDRIVFAISSTDKPLGTCAAY